MHSRHRIAAVIASLSLSAVPAIALPNCEAPSERALSIARLQHTVDEMRVGVERVPKADADYLREELRASIDQQSEGRFNLAVRSPYYHALQVHDEADALVLKLKGALYLDAKEQAVTLIWAGVEVSRFADKLSEYLAFDARRAPRVISKEASRDLHLRSALLLGNVAASGVCIVKALRPPAQP